MGLKVTNNAYGTLNASITSSSTTIVLSSGQGARFPTLSAGDYFYATLIDTSNNLEVVKVTARSTDTLTVVRGQDSTTARAYATNDRFELRPTAVMFTETITKAEGALQKTGDTYTGNKITFNKAPDSGAFSMRMTANGDGVYHSINYGQGQGFNFYAFGYQDEVTNNATATGVNGIQFSASSTSFEIDAFTGQTVGSNIVNSGAAKNGAVFLVDNTGQRSSLYVGQTLGTTTLKAFDARAWVTFDGRGTTIKKSANISSIGDYGTGYYRLNFTTSMPDDQYCLVATGNHNGYGGVCLGTQMSWAVSPQTGGPGTASYAYLESRDMANGANESDTVCAVIFR